MERQIDRIERAEVIETNGLPQPTLCLFDDRGNRYPVATKSWHVDIKGYITHPATGRYRDDWLPDVVGYSEIAGKRTLRAVRKWVETTDLSPLSDPDDTEGHNALCASLMEAIREARGGVE